MIIRLVLSLAVLAFFVQCGQQATVNKVSNNKQGFEFLSNKTWQLLDDNQVVKKGTEAYNLKFRMNENEMRYSAWFGCNNISGVSTVNGPKINFGQAMATKMYCPNPTQPDESTVMALLSKANNYKVLDGNLTLFEDRLPLLKFKAAE